jgi:ABC-type dipeptide/oligopeptide/nickel transport system permease subunit
MHLLIQRYDLNKEMDNYPPQAVVSNKLVIRTDVKAFPHRLIQLFRRDIAGIIGLAIFGLVVFTAIFAPKIALHDPLKQTLQISKQPPAWQKGGNWEYPLGTDNLGRDIFSRIVYGSRVSLLVGFFGAFIGGLIGLLVGLFAGYKGGRVDAITMSVVNVVMALPYLLFVVFIAGVLGRSLINTILIFAIMDAPMFVRVTRGEVISMRQSGYIESAISIGASQQRIIFHHIFPNLIGQLITVITFEMSALILFEASLGFLGLSVPPEIPSWGNMLEAGRKYLTTSPWMATYPGFAIMVTALGMNLFGDWLRAVLDPRYRRARK